MTDVRQRRLLRMLDDNELGGELLLIGLSFARFLDFGHPTPDGKKLGTYHIAAMGWPTTPPNVGNYRVKCTLAEDARRYAPPRSLYERRPTCMAPMIRRDSPCGRRSTRGGYVTDWATGEQTWLAACTRHQDWYRTTYRANRDARPAEPPLPAANHGGVLAKHIPEFDWPKIWMWATDGRWIRHPEEKPWPKPTLTVHLGDGDRDGDAPRPRLTRVGVSRETSADRR